MNEDEFDGQSLSEKLGKLNSSQQCIESLSRWCILHRKKAKQVVETWDNSFKSAKSEQRVSFLYLANDILQNSRRRGSEFVNEFWKYLPAAVKHVYDNGDENGKKVSSRLVDIWEERKVFGSRGQNLKDEILGKNPPPIASNGKSSSTIKVIKKDSQSLRIKLAVGGRPEKILSAFQLVFDENANEEGAFNNCRGVVSRVKEMEQDIEKSSFQGNFQASEWLDKIQEQENILRQCVSQLEKVETSRVALISQLKEALEDQETKLEEIRCELQVARGQMDQAEYMKQRLTSSTVLPSQQMAANPLIETTKVGEANITGSAMLPLMHPATFTTSKLTDEESKKATAAAVAAKLAASTSSAQMLTSVLSSLVAEEAASLGSSLSSVGFSSSLPFGSSDKRPKLEKPASFSDMNHSDGNHSGFFTSAQQQQPVSNMSLAPSVGMQLMSQGNQMQSPFPQPPPPPPPSVAHGNSPAVTQIGQSTATMMGVMPYGYGASSLPPPPLPSHLQMAFSRPSPLQQPPQQQQQQLQTQQPQQQQQPPSSNGGYYRPPGIGFYSQSHQPTTPPVPRQ